jgi:WD40 repeat protein
LLILEGSGRRIVHTLKDAPGWRALFSKDSKGLWMDRKAWAVETGEEITTSLCGGCKGSSVQLTPDGRIYLWGPRELLRRETSDLSKVERWTIPALPAFVQPDGSRVLCRKTDGTAAWYSIKEKKLSPLPSVPRPDDWGRLLFSPDGRFVLTKVEENACLFDLASGKEIHRFTHRNAGLSEVWAFSQDGSRLGGANEEECILFSLPQGNEVWRLLRGDDKAYIRRFWPIGSGKECALLISSGGTFSISKINTGEPTEVRKTPVDSACATILGGDRWVSTSTSDQTRLINLENGTHVGTFSGSIKDVTPDGSIVLGYGVAYRRVN